MITAIANESNPTSLDPTVDTLSAAVSNSIRVQVDADADLPSLSVDSLVVGNEDDTVAINISGALLDTDGSESLVIEIDGVPAGALLSAGIDLGGGRWSLTPAQLTGLTLTGAPHSDQDFQLIVTAISTESAPTSIDTTVRTAQASVSSTIDVRFDAVADAPIVVAPTTVSAAEGITSNPFAISASLADLDGSESLQIVIAGIARGATLSDGVNSFTAVSDNSSVDVSTWSLTNLTITPDDGPPADFTLSVIATASETSPTSTDTTVTVASTTTTALINVTVAPINDAPIANPDEFDLNHDGTPVDTGVNVLTNDTDEENDALTVTLVSGTSHGTVSLSPDGTFTYIPDAEFFGVDSFTYEASDHGLTSQTVTVTLNVGLFPPPFSSSNDTGEDTLGKPQDSILSDQIETTYTSSDPEETSHTSYEAESELVAADVRTSATAPTEESNGSRSNTILPNPELQQREMSFDQLFVSYSRNAEFEARYEPVANISQVTNTGLLWESLDQMQQENSSTHILGRLFVGFAALLFAAVSYFYVLWTVWSGYLASSVLSLMPGWRFIDPLPILDQADGPLIDDDTETLATIANNESPDADPTTLH